MVTIAERVQNGIELLDKRVPKWRDIVDTKRLIMRSRCDCVLGQLFFERAECSPRFEYGYDYGVDAFGFSQQQSADHGFGVSYDASLYSARHQRQELDDLETEWVRRIENPLCSV